MAVDINSVYQKVLALANKEQRGYITPQEFNLFADKAQNEIYENYFHQLNIAQLKPKSIENESDPVETIRQKLDFFITTEALTIDNGSGIALEFDPTIPSNRIIKITNQALNRQAIKVEESELDNVLANPLTAPTTGRPIYVTLFGNIGFQFHPAPGGTGTTTGFRVFYYRQPRAPNWTYVIVGGNALYNASGDLLDFELHTSEEENLVNRILILAGLATKHPDVQQSGAAMMQMNKQQQNS